MFLIYLSIKFPKIFPNNLVLLICNYYCKGRLHQSSAVFNLIFSNKVWYVWAVIFVGIFVKPQKAQYMCPLKGEIEHLWLIL